MIELTAYNWTAKVSKNRICHGLRALRQALTRSDLGYYHILKGSFWGLKKGNLVASDCLFLQAFLVLTSKSKVSTML